MMSYVKRVRYNAYAFLLLNRWSRLESCHKASYITHKNIPLILLVNTTSRDIKYYVYIPDI